MLDQSLSTEWPSRWISETTIIGVSFSTGICGAKIDGGDNVPLGSSSKTTLNDLAPLSVNREQSDDSGVNAKIKGSRAEQSGLMRGLA